MKNAKDILGQPVRCGDVFITASDAYYSETVKINALTGSLCCGIVGSWRGTECFTTNVFDLLSGEGIGPVDVVVYVSDIVVLKGEALQNAKKLIIKKELKR